MQAERNFDEPKVPYELRTENAGDKVKEHYTDNRLLNNANKRSKYLEDKLREAENKIQKITSDNRKLKGENGALKYNIEHINNKINMYEHQVPKLVRDNAGLVRELRMLRDDRDNLQESYQKLSDEYKWLRDDRDNLQESYQKLSDEYKRLSDAYDELKKSRAQGTFSDLMGKFNNIL